MVAIYIRVSTPDQAREGYSLAAQERALREHCERTGHEVYAIYADEGISGKDIVHRPAFCRLMDDARHGLFTAIYVWALSRFTRSVADLYNTWGELSKYGVQLVSITEGFDTSTPTGRAMMGVIGVFAQMERELTAERVRLAMQERAEQGKRTCSYVLGYDRDGKDGLKVNPEEAELVRLIYDKFIAYKSYLPIADLLNALGKTGKSGKPFKAESIKKILRNPIYIGYYRYKGKCYKGDFKPIIERRLWDKVQKIIVLK